MVLVGSASHYDTFSAVRSACQEFGHSRPALLFVLVGGRHTGEDVLRHLSDLFPGVRVAGGSVAGTVTADEAGYAGFGISVMAFLDPATVPSVFFAVSADGDDFGCALHLGREIARETPSGGCAILLYDSVAESGLPRLHFGSAIAAGFEQGLGRLDLRFVAAGLLTSANLDDAWVCVDRVLKHALVALVFPPALTLETLILPGSRSTGVSIQITSIDGAEVIALDGRPAVEVLCKALGRDQASGENVLALNVSLGQGDAGSGSGENLGRNRLVLSEDKIKGTVTLFEPDFESGDRVQILLQDSDYMIKEARRAVKDIRSKGDAYDTAFCVYFDCAGRSAMLAGSVEEEALVVMSGLPSGWPTIGGFTGVEIACVDGRYRALDLTGVLGIFHFVK